MITTTSLYQLDHSTYFSNSLNDATSRYRAVLSHQCKYTTFFKYNTLCRSRDLTLTLHIMITTTSLYQLDHSTYFNNSLNDTTSRYRAVLSHQCKYTTFFKYNTLCRSRDLTRTLHVQVHTYVHTYVCNGIHICYSIIVQTCSSISALNFTT